MAQQPEFEVATLKLSPPPSGDAIAINLGTLRNGTLTLANVTLVECIQYAYSVVNGDLIDGPDWIKSRAIRFDIVAKTSPETSQDNTRLMLRNLLSDRLKLTLHTEKKDMSFLGLGIAKNGPKLKPPNPTGDRGPQVAGRILHPDMSMAMLTMLLSRFERQTIVDMTGLKGTFTVDLQWVPDFLRERSLQSGPPPSLNGQPIDSSGPSIYTALQEQLGLRLESRKGPVDVLVVDHAEKIPLDN
ncbi:MAG TPA: TIGR03435 family protein [Terriglobia bacterium]|nr:TIGR03435 family protein [Terriglobia bacterium]